MRWFWGLIPAIVILVCLLVFGVLGYVAIWGLPSSMVDRVEQALMEKGVPVHIGALKVSLWPRAVVTLKDVEMLDPSVPEDRRPVIARMQEASVALNWKKLLDGEVDPERISVEQLSVNLPVNDNDPAKTFSISGLAAIVDLTRPGMVDVMKAEALVQGMRVTAQGAFAAGQESGQPFSLSAQDVEGVKRQLDQVLDYLNRLKWPENSPPVLSVSLGDDAMGAGVRVGLDVQAPSLSYGSIRVRDFEFNGDYADSIIMARHFSMRDPRTRGVVNLALRADLKERSFVWDASSTAPLVAWTMSLLKESLVPEDVEFLSEPNVRMSGRLVFNEGWNGLTHVNMLGAGSMGAFALFGEKFLKASGEFSYENGNFYVSELDIRHAGGELTGSVMGVNGDVKVDARSSLPMKALLNMARAVAPGDAVLPPTLMVLGKPELSVKGSLSLGKDWKGPVQVGRLSVNADVRNIAYQGVDFDAVTAKAELIGRTVNLNLLELKRKDGRVRLEGSYLGDDLVFTLESNVKPALLAALAGDRAHLIPAELTLPESADIWLHGRLDMPAGKPVEPTLIRARIKADKLAWNQVVVNHAVLEGEYRTNQLSIHDCRLELEKGRLELFANGFLDGQMFVMGNSSVSLATIDKLLNLNDDDFFMKRFAFRKDSSLDVAFRGTLGLYNPAKAYDFRAELAATNTKYNGVDIKTASADARIVTDQVMLSNVSLTVNNADYLAAAGLSGGVAACTLTAKSIDFRFEQNTVELLGLEGLAYPAHTLSMFSDSATKVLKEFAFSRPVKISGGGMFPMGDDMKLMKGRIRFDASSGRVKYKLLGTTLDLGKATGEVLISPQWVIVDKLKGAVWGGTFAGRVMAQIDDGDALNVSMVVQDLSLTEIGKSYDTKMEKATVLGAIELSSRGGNLNTIQAKGEAALINGNLVEIPLFGFLGEALSNYIPLLGHLINYKITRADCDFSIEKGYIRTSNFVAKGNNMSLEGGGWIRLADLQVDSDFKLGLRGIPGLLTSPVFLLARGFFQVTGRGPLNKVSWSFAPFSGGRPPVPPTGK